MRGRDPYFIHYVRNMEQAIAFYNGVFDVHVSFTSPGWSTLDFEGFTLALHILSDGHDDQPIPNAGLNLLVDDIEDLQTRIEAAGGTLTELREPDDFVPVRVASFVDGQGNGFELRQAVGD